MKTCPKCNKELADDAKFCDECATEIFDTVFCPNCGVQTSTEFAFCQSCGAAIAEEKAETPPCKQPQVKAKFPKKLIMLAAAGVAVLAILIVVASLLFGGNSNNYALYIKDKEIFFYNMKKNSDPWQLTSRFIDNDDDMENSDIASAKYGLGMYTYLSEDGKYIFFPDKVSEDGMNLYLKKIAKPDEDAVKIDSSITGYFVNKSSTLVIYLKENNLYQYDIKKDAKDKIASDVSYFVASDDGKKVIYETLENDIYLKHAGKDKEKIASEIESLEHINDKLTVVYYIKEDSLYKHEIGKDKVKIASDVENVITIYESGEIYYTKENDEDASLMDYVIDDMKSTDAAMTKPTRPTAPSWYSYDTYAEYEAAYAQYEIAYQKYQEDYQAYQEKLSRDSLRTSLANATLYNSSYTLCYYNGKEEKVITDASVRSYATSYATDAAVIVYEIYNQSEVQKMKISEISSTYDVREAVNAALFSSKEMFIAVKGSSTIIEAEKEIKSMRLNASGTLLYYVDDVPDDKNYGGLYRIQIKNGKVGKPELYDNDVSYNYSRFIDGDEFAYAKDYDSKDYTGEMYINKKKVDSDVYVGSVQYIGNAVHYLTDWNSDKRNGTLKVYDGDKATKIADDVADYGVSPDGQVLYLTDYSMNSYKGELCAWSNGKSRKIDDDVVCILYHVEGRYRGNHYAN